MDRSVSAFPGFQDAWMLGCLGAWVFGSVEKACRGCLLSCGWPCPLSPLAPSFQTKAEHTRTRAHAQTVVPVGPQLEVTEGNPRASIPQRHLSSDSASARHQWHCQVLVSNGNPLVPGSPLVANLNPHPTLRLQGENADEIGNAALPCTTTSLHICSVLCRPPSIHPDACSNWIGYRYN